MSHQTILDNLKTMLPGVMHGVAQEWQKVGDAVMWNSAALSGKVQRTVAQGWEGATADAIVAATRRFTDDLADVHNVMQSVHLRIQSAAYGAEAVKAAVPKVTAAQAQALIPGLVLPNEAIGAQGANSEAEQAARMAMVNHYVPTYQPAGQQVPTFVAPQGPGGTSNDGGGGLNPGWSGGAGGPGGDTPGSKSPGDGAQNNEQQQPGTNPANQSPDSAGQQGNPMGNASDRPGGSDATRPAGFDSTSTTPAGFTPGSGGGSTGGGYPGGGYAGGGSGIPGIGGFGSGGGGSVAGGGPGRSIPGGPGAVNPAGGVLGGAGRPAAAGAAGMPGMAPPGGKGKGEDDKEHKRPDWLTHERNTIELLGEYEPTVPPVLGADAQSTETEPRENRER
ncbi:WXG100 family type VII secretion target [Nocardia sp. NPDC051570]|uniref:WXG100 family type VII secretion target n=1 Tax=Nocardia sp. NPDC051570 TaxID=3364324 RepID=UPI0037AB3973